MTARKDTAANRLLDWASSAQPGDRYLYGHGDMTKPHDRVFGAARRLAEHGLFALFGKGRKRFIVRVSDRARRFLVAAARW